MTIHPVLKKKLIISGSALAFMLVLTAIVGGILYSFLDNKRTYSNRLTRETRDIQSRITRSKNNNKHMVESLTAWEKLSTQDKAMKGLRLSEAKKTLDNMVDEYWLSDVRTTFSKPAIVPHEEQETFNIASSNVSISFNGVSDTMIYTFLDALNEDFPGIIVLKKFSIDKQGTLERETIKQIASGQKPSLFRANVEFEWKDIKK